MGLSYKKLWKLLIDKGLNKSDLCEHTGISRSTLAKLNDGENINTDTLEKICIYLNCDISDVVEMEANKNDLDE